MKQETQIHVAVTMMGNKFDIDPKKHKDKEIAQWAASFPAKQMGSIPKSAIDQMFLDFKEATLDKMRSHGILRAGH